MTNRFPNSSNNNNCSILVVTVIFIIIFFEVMPERSIWSIPIEPEDEHIIAFPGLGSYSLLLIQKEDENTSVAREGEF